MKKLKTSLVKHVIKTDFFILEKKKLKNIKIVKLTSNKDVNVLDIVELNFSLKQFIRVLQFVKKLKLLLNIFISNKQFVKLIENFLKNNLNSLNNTITLNKMLEKKLKKNYYSQFDLLLDSKNILQNKFFIFQVNSIIEHFDQGKYKIFNSLDSFKKLVFFLSIFYNVLKKNKIHETKQKV